MRIFLIPFAYLLLLFRAAPIKVAKADDFSSDGGQPTTLKSSQPGSILSRHPLSNLRKPGTSAFVISCILVGLALRVVLHFVAYPFFADDAYIFLRYDRNALQGMGLSYNPGEHVLGFTSPLYLILLLSQGWILGTGSLTAAALWTNLLLFGLLVWCAARLEAINYPGLPITPIFLCIYYPFVDGSLNGMETTLFCVSFISAVLASSSGRPNLAVVLGALALLVRPEGIAVLMGVIFFECLIRKSGPWRGITAGLVILTGWSAFSLATYGTVLPQSMLAKSAHVTGQYYGGWMLGPLPLFLQLAFGLSNDSYSAVPSFGKLGLAVCGFAMTLVTAYGVRNWKRSNSALLLLPAVFLSNYLIYLLGKPVGIFSWYAIPTSLVFWASAVLGSRALLKRPRWRMTTAAGLVLLGIVSLLSIWQGANKRSGGLAHTGMAFEVTKLLHSKYPDAKSVLVGDIGVIGYFGEWRIVDLAGLVTPSVLEKGVDGDIVSIAEIIEREVPDILLLRDDPRKQASNNDAMVRRATFRSAAEREEFEMQYQELPADPRSYHVIFVRRALWRQNVE